MARQAEDLPPESIYHQTIPSGYQERSKDDVAG